MNTPNNSRQTPNIWQFFIRSVFYGGAHAIVAFAVIRLYTGTFSVGLLGTPGHRMTGMHPTAESAKYVYALDVLLFPFIAIKWLFHPQSWVYFYPGWFFINSFFWGMAICLIIKALRR